MSDRDETKVECPRCLGRGRRLLKSREGGAGGRHSHIFERVDCWLCEGARLLASGPLRRWVAHGSPVDKPETW